MTDETRRSVPRRVAVHVAHFWQAVGLALVLFLALEFGYRAQLVLKRAVRAAETVPPGHPYEREEWWRAWVDGAGGWKNRSDPYQVRVPVPQAGRYLNIDSLGRRVTVQTGVTEPPQLVVFMLGGSTMWGYTARDEHTIASRVAHHLKAKGVHGARVENLARSTTNLTQGLITLALQLRDGHVPDVVVFLDGNNEVAPAFRYGEAGSAINQHLLSSRLSEPSLISRIAAKSLLVTRLRSFLEKPVLSRPVEPDAAALCADVARLYKNLAAAVEALADGYGFRPYLFWQPMLATSGKRRSPWEESIRPPEGYREFLVTCSAAVDSAMRGRLGATYFPLHDVFDTVTKSVFLDDYGHVTERGNDMIAHRIADILAGGSPR